MVKNASDSPRVARHSVWRSFRKSCFTVFLWSILAASPAFCNASARRGFSQALFLQDKSHITGKILSAYDIRQIKNDFPILNQSVNGHKLIWLDNAATTQKPRAVIDATSHFYERDNSNIHRAAHTPQRAPQMRLKEHGKSSGVLLVRARLRRLFLLEAQRKLSIW